VMINVGTVKKKTTKKLAARWKGPFRIREIANEVNAIMETMNGHKLAKRVHVNRLKLFYEREDKITETDIGDIPDLTKREIEQAHMLNKVIAARWPNRDNRWFLGEIISYDKKTRKYIVKYFDEKVCYKETLTGSLKIEYVFVDVESLTDDEVKSGEIDKERIDGIKLKRGEEEKSMRMWIDDRLLNLGIMWTPTDPDEEESDSTEGNGNENNENDEDNGNNGKEEIKEENEEKNNEGVNSKDDSQEGI